MRVKIAAALVMLAGPASAAAGSLPYDQAARLTCHTFLGLQSNQLSEPIFYALTDHFIEVGEQEYFGSSCNINDYVKGVCARNKGGRFTVGQAVESLFALRRSGKALPPIRQCGA